MGPDRKPDFEIVLTQEQLTKAVGDYCSSVLRAIPVGQYEQTQLSVWQVHGTGEARAVFRAWAPPGVLSEPTPIGVYADDGHPAIRLHQRGLGEVDVPPPHAQYTPIDNEPEPEDVEA